ncbi:hypothetical protein OVY01_11460 [Robbsia sp. Bb-Pol-6]|uniref:Uncharacterized protein n=1 Tax=Robbsia betulipollinis TaxID=2981849 RepID=A0ABT3ZNL1_9BURK|nr:hypothetical protein [Robbsia betulipollinis]MCY0387840.1 hypothetical protein [Robbsia betulipollinis]
MTAYRQEYAGIMAHFWTLSIEEQFYLIIAPVLLFATARHHIAIYAVGLLMAIAKQYGFAIAGQDAIFIPTFSINNFGVMLWAAWPSWPVIRSEHRRWRKTRDGTASQRQFFYHKIYRTAYLFFRVSYRFPPFVALHRATSFATQESIWQPQ